MNIFNFNHLRYFQAILRNTLGLIYFTTTKESLKHQGHRCNDTLLYVQSWFNITQLCGLVFFIRLLLILKNKGISHAVNTLYDKPPSILLQLKRTLTFAESIALSFLSKDLCHLRIENRPFCWRHGYWAAIYCLNSTMHI